MRTGTLAIIALFIAAIGAAQVFEQAEELGTDPIEPDFFTFSDGSRTCKVASNGVGICQRLGRRDWRFRLPLSDGVIRTMFFAPLSDDLLLAYELDDGEGGWGYIVRLARGARQPAWKFFVPGLNMSAPVLYEDSVIVAALAFVARVRMTNGGAVWRLDRAYGGDGYEIPHIPLSGTEIILQSQDGTSGKIRVECFNLKTGACAQCGS